MDPKPKRSKIISKMSLVTESSIDCAAPRLVLLM